MPDTSASPYLGDLKYLGKINHGSRNLYRDEQLNLAGVGEKVRQLIEEHLHATGVDSKIPPVDLFAVDFKTTVDEHKSDRTKASEIEHAIRHHIKVNLEEDEEYYKSLSEKLNELLKLKDQHWDELVQLLFAFRATMKDDRNQAAQDLGLSDVEFSFHNILVAEIARATGDESMAEATHDEVIAVTRQLVEMLDEATSIVDFFNKQDEIRRVQKKIKRAIIETSFDDAGLRKAVMDRFMELAKVKFK
jgi:type I restriction enzyme R subunit